MTTISRGSKTPVLPLEVPAFFFLLLSACATSIAPDDDGGTPGDSGGVDSSKPDSGTGDTGSGACTATFSGVLASFDFTAEAGNQASTASKSTAPSVTAGAFTRSQGLMATTGAGSMNSSGWPTAMSADPMLYYTFSVTPPAGCAMDITEVAVDSKSSATGPSLASLATSADSFGSKTTFAVNMATKATPSVSGQTSQIEVRLYGYGASATTGTWRVQNTLTISGALK